MKINLKKFALDKEATKFVQKRLYEQDSTRGLANKLKNVIKFLEEVETDLELGGECIVELDKSRLDAIKERNKMLTMLNEADDDV